MDPLLETAVDAARAAARVHRAWRAADDPARARLKGRSDFVSQVDLESEAAALRVIRSRHPEHRVMAEEGHPDVAERARHRSGEGESPQTAPPLWIVDPLDGTTNFLHGYPQYAASVAVADEEGVRAGAVASESLGSEWWAHRGGGAWKNGKPIRVSTVRALADVLVGTGFPFKSLEQLPDYLPQLGRMLRSTSGVRRAGSAALDLCMLAEGALDGFWELHLHPWDIAAGIVIVEEAGGCLCRPDGRPPSLTGPAPLMAANSRELLAGLQEVLDDRSRREPV